MKYIVLNSYAGYGSTGRIAEEVCEKIEKDGNIAVLAHGRKRVNCEKIKTYQIDTQVEVVMHGVLSRLFDTQGLHSKFATYRFIKWMDNYQPDVILINNIHGYYLNYPMLFDYIKKIIYELNGRFTIAGLLQDIVPTLQQQNAINGKLDAVSVRKKIISKESLIGQFRKELPNKKRRIYRRKTTENYCSI